MIATRTFVCTTLAAIAITATPAAVYSQESSARVSLSEALQIIDVAQKEAAAKNVRLSIAVVDARGDLIAIARMPGAGAGTSDTAIGKAMLSAIYGQPSAALIPRATSPMTQALNDATGGRFRFLQGALPLVRGGFTVGAVAASGAAAQQDEDVVRAALMGVPLQ